MLIDIRLSWIDQPVVVANCVCPKTSGYTCFTYACLNRLMFVYSLQKSVAGISFDKGRQWYVRVLITGRIWACNREVANFCVWGVFILHVFIVIHWGIKRSCFLESQWNMPYPVWKCLAYRSPQHPYCLRTYALSEVPISLWPQDWRPLGVFTCVPPLNHNNQP